MTQLPEFLIKIIGIVLGKTFILYFLLFILVSYLLLALLTWSFIKPLKYLGIPFIVVGILTLIARFVLPIILVKSFFENWNYMSSIRSACDYCI